MSFEIRLLNGDLSLDKTGNFESITKTSKLQQDILKILQTEFGSNRFHPNFGSSLTSALIGKGMPDDYIVQNTAEETITESLDLLRSEQEKQTQVQEVDPEEVYLGIRELIILKDQIEPRQYNIFLEVISQALTTERIIFSFAI